jgi:hypothetical protein
VGRVVRDKDLKILEKMNEKAKLKEANYFLNRMKEVKANYEEFVWQGVWLMKQIDII